MFFCAQPTSFKTVILSDEAHLLSHNSVGRNKRIMSFMPEWIASARPFFKFIDVYFDVFVTHVMFLRSFVKYF